jgi:leader peptidase (prepilin peptidase)/N-methyltransferase
MSGNETVSTRPTTAYWWQSCAAVLAAAAISFALLPAMSALFSTLLAGIAIWIAWVDLDRLIIPDLANAAMAALGLLLVIIETPTGARMEWISDALMRSIVAGGLLFLVRLAFARMAGKEGLGLGDVKLMAAGATFLSWTSLPYSIVLAAAAAMMVIALRAIRQRAWHHRETEIPFGAFLAPAIWIAFLLERLDLL